MRSNLRNFLSCRRLYPPTTLLVIRGASPTGREVAPCRQSGGSHMADFRHSPSWSGLTRPSRANGENGERLPIAGGTKQEYCQPSSRYKCQGSSRSHRVTPDHDERRRQRSYAIAPCPQPPRSYPFGGPANRFYRCLGVPPAVPFRAIRDPLRARRHGAGTDHGVRTGRIGRRFAAGAELSYQPN